MTAMRSRQRGVSTVFWIVSMAGVLGLGTLAWDMNNLFVATAELQSAVDAGAMEGAANLYWNPANPESSGSVIRRTATDTAAKAAVAANLARGTPPESVQVEIGHWRFDPAGGGTFTADTTGTITPPELFGKVFGGTDPTEDLNNCQSGDINAVRVTASRDPDGTPVQALVGGFLGFGDGYGATRTAIAYVGYADGVDEGVIDWPFAMCQESIRDPTTGQFICGVGQLIPANTDTAMWTSYEQPCGNASAADLTKIIGSPGKGCFEYQSPAIRRGEIAVNEGQVNKPYKDMEACFEETTNRTECLSSIAPVLNCSEGSASCKEVVSAVALNVLWVLENNPSIVDDSPTQFTCDDNLWTAPDLGTAAEPGPGLDECADLGWPNAPPDAAGHDAEAYGKCRWDSFVTFFGILGNDGSLAFYENDGFRQKTVYIAPSCTRLSMPTGVSSARNFGIRARVPVLVGGGDDDYDGACL